MRISLFSNAYDNRPMPWEGSWEDFCEGMREHDYSRADKEGCPAFCPAEFVEGSQSRLDSLVVAVHAWVLDVDHATESDVLGLVGACRDRGLAALVYTTWRHAEDPWRVRIVGPFDRPVAAAAWPATWDRLNYAFGGACDPKCRNPARIYFGPFAPAGTEAENFTLVLEGQALSVDALGDVVCAQPVAAGEGPLPWDRLEKFAKQLARKSNERQAELGERLLRVCRGEVFAEPGERDTTVFRLSGILARRFHDSRVESIADHFRASLALMTQQAGDCPTVEGVAYKLRRERERMAEEEDERLSHHGRRVREAFRNGRSEPYTPDEIASLGENAAIRWVIQRGGSYYFRVFQDYFGPYSEKEAMSAAYIDLSPASSAGVELFRLGKNGEPRQLSMVELVQKYGTVAVRTEIHLAAQASYYDEHRRCIVEAPCPRRPLVPKFHPEIQKWLEIFAGPKQIKKLLDWLAFVIRLEDPCVGLLLTGPKGTGKNLLTIGISRIWTTTRPTDLAEVFSDFNESLIRCPLCFADEQLPKDHRGYSKNAELKHHIQTVARSLRRKFQVNADVIGAMRTVVAANNEDILQTPENLSTNDIDAIVERYLHIVTQEEAAEYLRNVDTTDWVSGDQIAEHVLWLTENHLAIPEGRFLINVTGSGLGRHFSTNSGPRGAICQWLTLFLLDRGKFENDGRSRELVRVTGGRLLVNVQGLLACWSHYVSNEPLPPTGKLSTAIIALCEPNKRVQLLNSEGVKINYRVIDVENLVDWAERHGFAERTQIEAKLRVDTIIRENRLTVN